MYDWNKIFVTNTRGGHISFNIIFSHIFKPYIIQV